MVGKLFCFLEENGTITSFSTIIRTRLNQNLVDMESSHHIPQRWLPTDRVYKDSEFSIMNNKKEQILLQIWNTGQHRMFLLQLKRKYAGKCSKAIIFLCNALFLKFDCRWPKDCEETLYTNNKRN